MDCDDNLFRSLCLKAQFFAILWPKSFELSKTGSSNSNYIIQIYYFDFSNILIVKTQIRESNYD